MKARNEGTRRITLVLSFVSVMAWLWFVSLVTYGFSNIRAIEWVSFFIGVGIAFYIPVAVRNLIYWIKDGQSRPSLLNMIGKDRVSKKTREELFDYKKLLDEGILTQEEYDSKASELKKIIL